MVFSKQDMGISAEKMRVYPMPMNPGWNRHDSGPQSVAPIGELPLTALSTRDLLELDDVVTDHTWHVGT